MKHFQSMGVKCPTKDAQKQSVTCLKVQKLVVQSTLPIKNLYKSDVFLVEHMM